MLRKVHGRLAACLLIAGVAIASPAHAALIGSNGKIAFSHCTDSACNSASVWTMDGNGANAVSVRFGSDDPAYSPSGRVIALRSCGSSCQIAYTGGFDRPASAGSPPAGGSDDFPAWSPDGKRLAWQRCTASGPCAIWLSGPTTGQLTAPGASDTDSSPTFSADGARIAYQRCSSPTDCAIRVINSDGTGDAALTSGHDDEAPNWSSDGGRIVFQRCCDPNGNSQIFTMLPNGAAITSVTTPAATEFDAEPAFSPDGTQLVFVRTPVATSVGRIATVPDAGGAVTLLTNPAAGGDYKPDWQPGPPVFSTPPTIGGTALNGQRLTSSSGSVVGGGTTTWEWYRCDRLGNNCLRHASGYESTYLTLTDDIGHTLKLRQIQTNLAGVTKSYSKMSAVVAPSKKRCFNYFAPPKVSMTGSSGGDRIPGDDRNNHLAGGAGADCIKGGGGSDRISGGTGPDDLWGEDGNDRISGGAGNDKIWGGAGKNRISAGSGQDAVYVNNGRVDVVDCGPGRDSVRADRVDKLRRCERVRAR